MNFLDFDFSQFDFSVFCLSVSSQFRPPSAAAAAARGKLIWQASSFRSIHPLLFCVCAWDIDLPKLAKQKNKLPRYTAATKTTDKRVGLLFHGKENIREYRATRSLRAPWRGPAGAGNGLAASPCLQERYVGLVVCAWHLGQKINVLVTSSDRVIALESLDKVLMCP